MESINLSFVAAVILGVATLVLSLMYAYMRVTRNLTVSNLNHWISSCQKAHEEELDDGINRENGKHGHTRQQQQSDLPFVSSGSQLHNRLLAW